MKSLILAVLVLATLACGDPAPPPAAPPALDLASMEPQVAARIETAFQRVDAQPGVAAAWGELGMVLHAHALFAEAADCYRRAMELDPADERWPYLAALALETDDLIAALELYAAAGSRTPRNPAFYVNHGNALLRAGEPQRAELQYRAALDLDPSSSHALLGLARVERAAGRAEAALEHLTSAAAAAPHHGEVHALLAQVHHQRGEAEAARAAELRARAFPDATRPPDPVVEAMETQAVSSRAYTRRGLRLAGEGRFAEAEEAFRQVLAIRPGNAHDHANLGGALARQGKLEQALAAYREAIRVEPGEPAAHNNLAMALAEQGRVDEAEAELAEAIRLDPAYAAAHDNLGLLRQQQQRHHEAAAHHEKAIDVDPAFADAYNHLGIALAAGGRLADAVARWRQALALDPRHLSVLYNLGNALTRTGEHAEAIARLREGLAFAPNSSRFVSLLAWQLATAPEDELRDGTEALALARRLAVVYPDEPATSDLLAAALAETGDFEAAAQAARKALELAVAAGQRDLAQQIRGRIRIYESGRPFRQPATR